jgi:hypothetical protein
MLIRFLELGILNPVSSLFHSANPGETGLGFGSILLHMPKRDCLIDIDLVNAVNQFLYGMVGLHDLKLRCPGCKRKVEPVMPNQGYKEPKTRRRHFRHVTKTTCPYYLED